jgi:putative hydrolase of the HAD superfamily
VVLEAVIFDWGGVVAEDPAPGLVRYCAQALRVPPRAFQGAFARFGRSFQSGILDERRFWSLVCNHLYIGPPKQTNGLWGRAFRAVYRPRPEVLLLIGYLKGRGIRTALLSNTEPACVEFFRTLGYRCFDQTIFSCQVGMTKPDPAIYRLAVQRLGSIPARTLFIDDRPSFIRAARSIGLMAEVYQGTSWLWWVFEAYLQAPS